MTQLPVRTDTASLPVTRAQPDYLETVARVRGMRPAPAAQARVLELNCAAGRNLLPLADRYPEARFVGIDSSAEAVTAARDAAEEVALANVEFRQLDVLELGEDVGTFDYIIAHDVYSSVDAERRDGLLALCRDHLAPHGIAYVSYRTYPGWAVHDMLRHMMLYEARQASGTTAKVTRARMFLEFLANSANQNEPYGMLVRGELAALRSRSDGDLLHDYLQDFCHAVYFPEFAQHAARFSLQPAGDGALGIRQREYLGEELEQQLESLIDNDNERELYRDVVRHRTIRQTLLCHQGNSLPNSVAPETLQDLYLEGALRPENTQLDVRASSVESFASRSGIRISTNQPLVKAALLHLGEAWPDYVRFADCVAAACAKLDQVGFPTPIPTEEISRLEANLTQGCIGGVLEVHSAGPSYSPTVSQRPIATPLVRRRAGEGAAVANLRHEGVPLDPFERKLVELLDGSRDRPSLVDLLATEVSERKLTVTNQQQPVRDIADAKRAIEILLPAALTRLARAALLVG